MARGEIQLKLNEVEEGSSGEGVLPEGVALGPDGNMTTNPQEALQGAQLPFGGYKGANIAAMVELMSAVLTGSPLSIDGRDAAISGDNSPFTRSKISTVATDSLG